MRGLVALVLLAAACSAPSTSSLPQPSAGEASPPPPAASPSASQGPRVVPPASAGVVPDAGVLYVFGSDDIVSRYDPTTGALDPVWRSATLLREGEEGAYVLGRHGGVTLLRWDGGTVAIECGRGKLADVSVTGACASLGGEGADLSSVWIRLPFEKRPRLVLPTDWGASAIRWSPDGERLVLVRTLAQRPPGAGIDPGLDALWLMEADGRLREIYRPGTRGRLLDPRWSPDGRFVVVTELSTTSASIAADGLPLLLVEVESRRVTSLGIVLRGRDWAQWSLDGRLAYVGGAGRMTWVQKDVVIRAPDGSVRVARAPAGDERVGLAPAWDPAHGRLAWVSGPVARDAGDGNGYLDGKGAGARVAVMDDGAAPFEVRCGDGRVVEGVRWSSDGAALLLLCRRTGPDPQPLEVWLHRLADGTQAPLVTGLASVAGPEAGGFGFYDPAAKPRRVALGTGDEVASAAYGAHPSLFTLVGWSRAAP